MEVDATTLLGHDNNMMGKTIVLGYGMSHLVLDEMMTRGMDRITSRLDHAVTIGPTSPRDQRMVNNNGNQSRYGSSQSTQ